MKQMCLLVLLGSISFGVSASSSCKQECFEDAVFSMRYSTTDITNATLPTWGVGAAKVQGAGKFGFAATIDYQTFGADWSFHFPDNPLYGTRVYLDGSWGTNFMFGPTYGVSDNFYVVPKIGITYNKLYYGLAEIENAKPHIEHGKEDRYDASFGFDAMFSLGAFVGGVGISNYYHFVDRETKINVLLGYRF